MSAVALRIEDVTVEYPGAEQPALLGCTMELENSERVALLGLNGSGKTTLLLTVAGLVGFSGRIKIFEHELNARNLSGLRGRMGFLFSIPEDQLLLPSVLEDVALSLLKAGLPPVKARERARMVLDNLGIAGLATKAPYQLSHGQRLMAALAGVLAARPELLLLDEPTGRLDPPSRSRLLDLLGDRSSTLLVATHDLEFAQALCTRFVLLEKGQIVRRGTDFETVREYWCRLSS